MSKLRVWHIQNVPNSPDLYPVETVQKAKNKIRKLVQKDLDNSLVHSNAFGLEEYDADSGDWFEWYNEAGEDILGVLDREAELG